VSAQAAPGGGWLRELARAAAAPVICAAVAIGLLSAWVSTGGAGTITVNRTRILVTVAAIPMHSLNPGPANALQPDADCYLTILNLTGTPDVLTAVSSPVARRVILTRHAHAGAAGSAGLLAAGLAIPAHGTIVLSPSGDDVVLIGGPLLLAGQQVPLTLTFRYAGKMTIEATVTIPGAPLVAGAERVTAPPGSTSPSPRRTTRLPGTTC
jgi:copper(I)-binding protein